MSSSLHYDIEHMLLGQDLKHGVSAKAMRELDKAHQALCEQRKRKAQGWFDLPFDREMVKRVETLVAKTKKYDTLLVLGIGGNDLGTRSILQALGTKRRVVMAGNNTDPDELAEIFSTLDFKKTLVNIASKSGDTIESMTAFLLAREKLKKAVGKNFASHIVATTSATHGTLSEWMHREKYHELVIPENVGGRFSVLTDVGLFPAAWTGISIKSLLAGAAEQMRLFEKEEPKNHPAAVYALLHAEGYRKQGRHLFVLMPYANHLTSFAFWYRQLIAESLGKAKNRAGLNVSVGPTAIAAFGASDQHSQIQLYKEGPQDKLITFIEVKKFQHKITLPAAPFYTPQLDGIAGRSLHELIHAERKATADALAASGRPNGTIFISELTPSVLGELFQFFMLATAYLGEFLDVNAYDQPGVQDGKKRFHEWLRAKG